MSTGFHYICILRVVSWVVMSEVMTTHLRSKAFGLFVSINWGVNLIIGLFTLTAIDGLGGTDTSIDDDDEVETYGLVQELCIIYHVDCLFRFRRAANKAWLLCISYLLVGWIDCVELATKLTGAIMSSRNLSSDISIHIHLCAGNERFDLM